MLELQFKANSACSMRIVNRGRTLFGPYYYFTKVSKEMDIDTDMDTDVKLSPKSRHTHSAKTNSFGRRHETNNNCNNNYAWAAPNNTWVRQTETRRRTQRKISVVSAANAETDTDEGMDTDNDEVSLKTNIDPHGREIRLRRR